MIDTIEPELEVSPPPRRVAFRNRDEAVSFFGGLVLLSLLTLFLLTMSWTAHIALVASLLNLPASLEIGGFGHSILAILLFDPTIALFVLFYAIAPVMEWRICAAGIPARAIVTRKESMPSRNGNSRFILFYEFMPEDASGRPQKLVQGRCLVQGDHGDGIEVGQQITILYLRKHPNLNHPCRFRRYRIVG
jgi:hypothetical protein